MTEYEAKMILNKNELHFIFLFFDKLLEIFSV